MSPTLLESRTSLALWSGCLCDGLSTLCDFLTCRWAALSWQSDGKQHVFPWPRAFYPWPFPKASYPPHSNYTSQVGQSRLDFLLCGVSKLHSTPQPTLFFHIVFFKTMFSLCCFFLTHESFCLSAALQDFLIKVSLIDEPLKPDSV